MEAEWAERDKLRTLCKAAEIWCDDDPRSRDACAFTHWLALVEAGLFGGKG